MLDDTSRKILRILFSLNFFNFSQIDVSYIARVSIRSEQQVKEAINNLVIEQYIEWDKQDNAFKVLRLNK